MRNTSELMDEQELIAELIRMLHHSSSLEAEHSPHFPTSFYVKSASGYRFRLDVVLDEEPQTDINDL